MEPAKPKINNILCLLHDDFVRKVSINDKDELALLCIECVDGMEENQKPERYVLENFIEKVVQSYAQIPKLQLPESTTQILSTENEIIANFSHHIEQEKEKVHNLIEKLRQSVYQKLESKKRQLIANLDAQVKLFEDVLVYYKQNVDRYKKGEDQETAPTFESMLTDVSKMTNATELKKLFQMHFKNIKSAEIFSHMKGDEAKKLVTDAIKAMDTEFIKAQTIKPTIFSFGANNEGVDETLKKWNEQIDDVLNVLKIDVKNPVKMIKFHLQDTMDFDSVILGNSLENKKMIANWVSQVTKAGQIPFKLLYRGSKDGFSAYTFHQKCDNKGPTVVIIKSNYGKVFGGFTDVAWDSTTNDFKKTTKAFVFSIDRKSKYHVKPGSESKAIYSHSSYGPTFGSAIVGGGGLFGGNIQNHDIYISNNSNISGNSYSNFPHSYICNEYVYNGNSNYLAGAYNFAVTEIEVYSV